MDVALNICIVDDDRDVGESLANILELYGHRVVLAFDADEAIRAFREKDFDITFMDMSMPGMDGLECFRRIREIRPDARVFLMTGHDAGAALSEAREDGLLGVLNKPVAPGEVLASLASALP